MLYRQKFDTFIRRYDDIGYITNNSDFSDRVVNASAAVFLCALSRAGQTFEALYEKTAKQFIGVDGDTLKRDMANFYAMLEKENFIVSGKTEQELDAKDKCFSYSAIDPKEIKTQTASPSRYAQKDSHAFLQDYFKDNPHLIQFQIELTSRCNERCIHCYIPHQNKTSDIDAALFYDVLDQCREMNVLSLTLSGGEPMMHKSFVDFMQKAKSYDFSINVLTNLTYLNDEIVAALKSERLSSVQVSLYSMNPETHDAITQVPGSFYKTRDAIERLITNDIPMQISCPTMKQNKNDYIDVLKWANEHKIRAATDYIMMARYDHTTDNLDNRLSLEEVEKIIGDIMKNDVEYQQEMREVDINAADARETGDDIVCGVGVSSLCMVANGNMYPCPGWQGYVCGNVKETTLREIWENSPQVKYLRSLRKKDFPKCLKCPDKSFCAMCMVRNANENTKLSRQGTVGDPLIINKHFCDVAALNRKIVMDWKAGVKYAYR